MRILDEVLHAHGDELRRQARRHSVKPENADDALEDACLSFIRAYNGEPGIDAVRYMMVVVKTAAWSIDNRRRLLARLTPPVAWVNSESGSQIEIPDSAEPQEAYERIEYVRERARLLDGLKADEKTALVLFAAGYSYNEIAAIKGWTHTKVNRCIAEGRTGLKELLAARGERS